MNLLRGIQMDENSIDTLLQRCENGELTAEMVSDTIEAIHGEIGVKCDSIAEIIANNDGEIAMLKSEIARLTDVLNALETSNKQLKCGLIEYLKHQNVPIL